MADNTEFRWHFDTREAEEFFAYAGYKSRTMRTGYERLKMWMREEIAEHFAGEHEFDGAPWAPLTPKYAKWKEAKVGPMPVLQLYQELLREANSDGSYSITHNDFSYSVYVPNRVGEDYGHFHDEGTHKMVPRPWFIPEYALTEQIDHIFTDWLNDLKDANKRRRGRDSIASLSDIGIAL